MISLFGLLKKNVQAQDKLIDKYIDIPSDYTRLEYIEKNMESGHVNTNYIPTVSTRVNFSFMVNDWFSSTTNKLFGMDMYSGFSDAYVVGINAARKFYFYNYSSACTTDVTPTFNTKYEIDLSYGKAILNGTEYTLTPNQTEAKSNLPLYLFAVNVPSGVDQNYLRKELCGRIYRTKIYEGSRLKMDLIPVYNKKTQYYGFFDVVNNEFHQASNKTAFSGK